MKANTTNTEKSNKAIDILIGMKRLKEFKTIKKYFQLQKQKKINQG